MKVIIYKEYLWRVTARKDGRAYNCEFFRRANQPTRCGLCSRGVLIPDCEKCKVCHAEIEWVYNAEPYEYLPTQILCSI